jgi:tartrate dehydratase beta subunit/fumarate hydratase class I family protein
LQNLQRTNEKQNKKISEYEQQILENEGRILLGKRKDAKYQYKYIKKQKILNTAIPTQCWYLYQSIEIAHNVKSSLVMKIVYRVI